MLQKVSVWEFKGCVESISRVFQVTFKGVSGVFLRVFEATSKGVYQRSYWSVWKFWRCFKEYLRCLGKFHGCHREISRMLQECFTGDSSLLSQFQGEFQEGFKDLSSKFQGSFIKVSRIFHQCFKDLYSKFQGSFIKISRIFHRSFKDLS